MNFQNIPNLFNVICSPLAQDTAPHTLTPYVLEKIHVGGFNSSYRSCQTLSISKFGVENLFQHLQLTLNVDSRWWERITGPTFWYWYQTLKSGCWTFVFKARCFQLYFQGWNFWGLFLLKIDMEIDRLLGKVGVGPQVKQACFSNSRLSFRFCLLD